MIHACDLNTTTAHSVTSAGIVNIDGHTYPELNKRGNSSLVAGSATPRNKLIIGRAFQEVRPAASNSMYFTRNTSRLLPRCSVISPFVSSDTPSGGVTMHRVISSSRCILRVVGIFFVLDIFLIHKANMLGVIDAVQNMFLTASAVEQEANVREYPRVLLIEC